MSPREDIFVLGAVLLTTLVALGTYRTDRLLRELGGLPFNPLLAPAENGLKLALLALLVVLGHISGLPARSFGLVPPTSTDLLIGLLAGVAGWAISNLAALLAVARWGRKIISPLVIRAVVPRGSQQWLRVVPAMALSVLLEEVLFRAILLGGLSHWAPTLLLLLLSAVLFGLLHSIQGRLGILVAGGLGLGLGLLFIWRGSLWPPLLAHYVINMGQLVLAARWPRLLEA